MHKFLLWERLPAANRAADGTPTGWCQHFTRGEFQKQYEITISPCAPGHPLLLRNSPCNSYYETSFPDNVKEALGRVFNVLAAAYDYQQNGEDATIQFQGAGSRWIAGLVKEEVENAGFDLIKDNPVPDTTGHVSLRSLIEDGYNTVLTF
jgi:hypothetical protein